MIRAQLQKILDDTKKKMVFIVGPRQAGKTWLSKKAAEYFNHPVYLNYDDITQRQQILAQDWLSETDLVIFDELHKMPTWKNYLKGLYDTKPDHLSIIVTGSARLDAYKQSGDSLAGRYFVHHLLPLSLAELSQTKQMPDINRLLERSGFPEPYLAEHAIDADRWRQEYINSLITVDVLDYDNIKNLSAMRTTLELLRQRVGSPISYKNLAEDIGISPVTIKKYIDILESLYIIFRITPFSKNIARSLLKEPKLYFFDTGLVNGDHGAKFENLVALSLLKSCYAQRDYLASNQRLHYLRTKDKLEVDFALANPDNIDQLIEAKYKSKEIDSTLYHFSQKFNLPAIQVVKDLKLERQVDNIRVVQASHYLEGLYL